MIEIAERAYFHAVCFDEIPVPGQTYLRLPQHVRDQLKNLKSSDIANVRWENVSLADGIHKRRQSYIDRGVNGYDQWREN